MENFNSHYQINFYITSIFVNMFDTVLQFHQIMK